MELEGPVRITYVKEGGMWWADASLRFSAAADSHQELRDSVHKAMKEIYGPNITWIEVVAKNRGIW